MYSANVDINFLLNHNKEHSHCGQDSSIPNSSIHNLPVEITANIFNLALLGIPHTDCLGRQQLAFTLSHINQRLRYIAISTPKLWRYIYINHEKLSRTMGMICYQRSLPYSLSLSIDTATSTILVSHAVTFFKQCSARLEDLRLHPDPESAKLFTSLLQQLQAPRLKNLTLVSHFHETWAILGVPKQAPALESIVATNMLPVWLDTKGSALKSLQLSTLGKPIHSAEQFLHALAGFQHLRVLRLDCLHFYHLRSSIPEVPIHIHLPNLRILALKRMASWFLPHFLSFLHGPNLGSLTLDLSGFWDGTLQVSNDPWVTLKPMTHVHTLQLHTEHHVSDLPKLNLALLYILRSYSEITHLVLAGCKPLSAWTREAHSVLGKNCFPLSQLSTLEVRCSAIDSDFEDDLSMLKDYLKLRTELGQPQVHELLLRSHPSYESPIMISQDEEEYLSSQVETLNIV